MPIYEFQTSDGKIYEIEAPDENAALQAFQSIPVQQESPQENEPAINPFADALGAAGAGLARGTAGLLGLPGTIADLGNAGGEWLMQRAGLPTRSQAMAEQGLDSSNVLSSQSLQDAASALTGGATDYRGQTTAGRYAGTVGEFLPGAAIGGLSPANLAQFGVLPAVASEAAGQWTEGTGYEPMARIAAALVAPAIPGAVSRAVSPFGGSIGAERQAAVDYLRNEGINPTAGQVTGSRRLLATESELAPRLGEEGLEQLTSAALKSAGINSKRATPEALREGYKALGNQFDDLASRASTPIDSSTQSRLLDIASDYIEEAPQVAPVVENAVNRIGDLVSKNNGILDGSAYQKMRSYLGSRIRSASDSNIKGALQDIQSVLDDAVEATLSGADKAAWQNVRRQYRNYLTVERAATSAGERAASGLFSPAQLRSAVANTQGRRSYAHASGELQNLARSAEQVMTALPNSGTAMRLDARTLGSLGAVGGGGAGAMIAGSPGAMTGVAAGLLAPYVAGSALSSRPVQAYLANQVAPNMSVMDPRTLNVIQSLLANQRSLEQ